MREIKFRGYSVKEKQWLNDGYGVQKIEYTDETEDIYLLTPYGDYEVYKESVGQYTGLKDINGKEIYEGDIVKIKFMAMFEDKDFIGTVKFYDGSFFVENEKLQKAHFLFRETDFLKVIGNIQDNSELLN